MKVKSHSGGKFWHQWAGDKQNSWIKKKIWPSKLASHTDNWQKSCSVMALGVYTGDWPLVCPFNLSWTKYQHWPWDTLNKPLGLPEWIQFPWLFLMFLFPLAFPGWHSVSILVQNVFIDSVIAFIFLILNFNPWYKPWVDLSFVAVNDLSLCSA